MKDGDLADQPLDGAEPFREVFGLADELVEQITGTEVEGRLRRLLEHQSANRQNQSAAPGPDPYGMSLAEAREGRQLFRESSPQAARRSCRGRGRAGQRRHRGTGRRRARGFRLAAVPAPGPDTVIHNGATPSWESSRPRRVSRPAIWRHAAGLRSRMIAQVEHAVVVDRAVGEREFAP